MVRLEFFDPSGALAPSSQHAPRLQSLRGRKIGFLSIDEWQAYRTFPLLRDLLHEDVPDSELLALDAFPRGIAPVAAKETVDLVVASGVDAVIIGNAA